MFQVRYKGKKLDSYKSSWLSKKRPLAMASMAVGGHMTNIMSQIIFL